MNPAVAKTAAKIGLGAIASCVVGLTIRQEKKLSEKIDEHYDNKDENDEETSTD